MVHVPLVLDEVYNRVGGAAVRVGGGVVVQALDMIACDEQTQTPVLETLVWFFLT